jgi:dimethylamine corrinoid protein
MATKEELIAKLSECVLEMEDEEIIPVAEEYIEEGYPAIDAIMGGLVDGMNKAGELFDEEEYFVTDILLCSDAMYAGLEILQPYLENTDDNTKKKAVIGVVEGDTHDIGKNLVKIMMETAGFEMYDLGRDVPLDSFVEKAKEVNADLICMSTLMTTTMSGMKTVINKLEEQGIRDQYKIMVGGSPVSPKFAQDIGADGYSVNAIEAVKVAKKLTGIS